MSGRDTLVVQSHNPDQLPAWQRRCLESARRWAASIEADYRFVDDDLFAVLPGWVLPKVGAQRAIAADLARLRLMQRELARGYRRVVWLDADLLVFAPQALRLSDAGHAVGREVWVQHRGASLRAYRKVHNAMLMACRGDSLLPYYADSAERLLFDASPPLAPQFLGPKLLSAMHNIGRLRVDERFGMLSPLALRDLLAGGGPALRMTLGGHAAPLQAVNLSGSLAGKVVDGVLLDRGFYDAAVDRLLAGGPLSPAAALG